MGRVSQMVTVFADNQMFCKPNVLFSVVRKWQGVKQQKLKVDETHIQGVIIYLWKQLGSSSSVLLPEKCLLQSWMSYQLFKYIALQSVQVLREKQFQTSLNGRLFSACKSLSLISILMGWKIY